MPGVGINSWKRGSATRQHQFGPKTRMLRNRNQAPQQVHDDLPGHKAAKEELTKHPCIPSRCNPIIPDLPCLGNIGFEFLLFLHLHTALFCQYIYLYKTVWWYPVSLPPSTTSLNFHLIDRNLTFFLSIFISRRLLWSVLWDFLRPNSDNSPGIIIWLLTCVVSGLIWIILLIMPLVRLFQYTSLLNMVVLCYPIVLWIPMTGLSGDSCLNLVLSWSSMCERSAADGVNDGLSKQHADGSLTRLLHPANTNNPQITYASFGNSTDPQVIRREAKLLRQDFNSRFSETVFCSMVCAYYVGLVPMFFMKSHQYYDMVWSLQHTVLVLLNSFGLLSSHLLNPQYIHVLHKCALLLGEFATEAPQNVSVEQTLTRSSYHKNEQTVGHSHTYAAQTSQQTGKNTGSLTEEDDARTMRFYYLFNNPLRLAKWLLLAHISIVLFQAYLLLSSSKWDHLISVALMQFYSYYVLFRSARDKIVLEKAHSLHDQMFKKVHH